MPTRGIKIFLKKKKKSHSMFANDTEILNMKTKNWFSIEKNITKCGATKTLHDKRLVLKTLA